MNQETCYTLDDVACVAVMDKLKCGVAFHECASRRNEAQEIIKRKCQLEKDITVHLLYVQRSEVQAYQSRTNGVTSVSNHSKFDRCNYNCKRQIKDMIEIRGRSFHFLDTRKQKQVKFLDHLNSKHLNLQKMTMEQNNHHRFC